MTTMYRALGHVDRAAQRADAPLRVVMATEGRKADGIDLRMAGARLDRFRANPVLGYGHNYWDRTDLPIGRVDAVTVDGPVLAGNLVFDPADEFAATIERKMRDGFLSAVSIGFTVAEWEGGKGDYWSGGVAEQWELSELSVVPIGMDANALVTAGRGAPRAVDADLYEAVTRWLGEQLTRAGLWPPPHLGEALRPPGYNPAGEPPADPEPAPPARSAVPESAARDFLAALKI